MLQDFETCRLCAEHNKIMSSVALFEKSCKLVLQRIFELTGVKLKHLTDIPSVICLDCEKDLNYAYEFRSRCITAQTYFASTEYKNRAGHHPRVKLQKTDPDLIKAEQLTCTTEKEPANSELEIKVEKNCNNDDESSTCDESEFIALDEIEFTDVEFKDEVEMPMEELSDACTTLKLDQRDSKKAAPANESIMVEETAEDIPQTDTLIERPKKTKSDKMKSNERKKNPVHLICDQCGNHFNNRSHFLTHIKRHTGIKTIQCEVCPDKFLTNPELKRHMRRHTGERPYGCKHCQRRFSDNSTRIKHERTHTNERPFECPQCDKAFTTGYILKNHMLVHTGERSFICVPCNKSFNRQTILDVHTRSLSHQQNVERDQKEVN